jgi:preprotein translocase subunit SecA
MLQNFVKVFGGDPHKKTVEQLSGLVEVINGLEVDFKGLSDEALRAKTDEFRARLKKATEGIEDDDERFEAEQEVLDEILPVAFAAVREASKRTIGLRPYDVQLIGGVVLHRGEIAEMRTGEGKTLVATLPLYLNALTGRGTHLVTVNDYLARRDARWMGPIYHLLGLSVGVLQMAATTENGKKAFLYDPERESPHEDQHQLRLVSRAEAYRTDITYGTNSEFGFDYLRDNMANRLDDRVQRGHHYAIIDEVDNVLIDEARTPLIISGPAQGDLEWYGRMAQIVKQLKPEDYEINEKDRSIALTELGVAHVEGLLGQPLQDPDRPEDVTPEQARLLGYLEQALRAQYLFKRNKDYLVQGGRVIIVDEFTGRLMPGRRWSDGLHQAVEAKEGARIEPENITYATITLQNYFRMYDKLAGMTGTALTEAEEFSKIYELEVLPIPTNLEYQAIGPHSSLETRKSKDEEGYEYTYYVERGAVLDTEPLFWKRKDYPDVIYRTAEAKLRATVQEIVRFHIMGRPMLIGTTSVESSEHLSNRLRAEPIRRLMQIFLVRRAWLQQNNRQEDGRLIEEFQPLNVPLEKLEPSLLRQFAKPLGMSISPEDPENLSALLEILDLGPEHTERFKAVLQGGVAHQVLNARKHTEESQIIAGAGAFGAVTIATNMAGRGVDIKLGGELAEEVIASVNRVLRRAGVSDPYEMSMEERRHALKDVDPSTYGIYETEVKYFLQYFVDMERVKALGGLHVIGSERHEARRIDNQLRGRSARQGDPGSSRFYLSLEDDLMRLFGGGQVSGLMERLRVDDSMPLENRMVGSIIEQSQHRVEGANFDVRKHLLEYDDVLNSQRERIYAQRDRVFTKQDLDEDVAELLNAEVEARVTQAFEDPEGPWRLIAWLEQCQPPFASGDGLYPSYGLRLMLDELSSVNGNLRGATLDLVRRAIEAEQERTLIAIETMIDRTSENLEMQLQERLDTLDTFLDAQRDLEEPRHPQELLEELSGLMRLPLRLSNAELRKLGDEPEALEDEIQEAIEAQITSLNATRMIGAIEYRLGESLRFDKNELQQMEWDDWADNLLAAARELMERQKERLVGEKGMVVRDLDSLMEREPANAWDDSAKLRMLLGLSQGVRTGFDSRTHRQIHQVFTRFNYVFLAAKGLEERAPNEVIDEVLEHLEQAQATLRRAWGQHEWNQHLQNAAQLSDISTTLNAGFSASLKTNDASPEAAIAILNEKPADTPLASLSEDERQILIDELGRHVMNEIQRQLLLGAITEQWVDYLTRVEALRVSVGLEAYAQRDPLVQYKSRASEMFQTLLQDIRAQVIARIFTYQPRQLTITLAETAQVTAPAASSSSVQGEKSSGKRKKKKRKRH